MKMKAWSVLLKPKLLIMLMLLSMASKTEAAKIAHDGACVMPATTDACDDTLGLECSDGAKGADTKPDTGKAVTTGNGKCLCKAATPVLKAGKCEADGGSGGTSGSGNSTQGNKTESHEFDMAAAANVWPQQCVLILGITALILNFCAF